VVSGEGSYVLVNRFCACTYAVNILALGLSDQHWYGWCVCLLRIVELFPTMTGVCVCACVHACVCVQAWHGAFMCSVGLYIRMCACKHGTSICMVMHVCVSVMSIWNVIHFLYIVLGDMQELCMSSRQVGY